MARPSGSRSPIEAALAFLVVFVGLLLAAIVFVSSPSASALVLGVLALGMICYGVVES